MMRDKQITPEEALRHISGCAHCISLGDSQDSRIQIAIKRWMHVLRSKRD